ncbi:MAG: glycine--tRNA ligase subunit beta [Candidatus Omnitrophota bacterium]
MKKEKADFLLEINVEELPVSYIRRALRFMNDEFLREFGLNRVRDAGATVPVKGDLGAKDKLICCIKDVPVRQEEARAEIVGPPKRIAFDERGNPTKQALGFAKNQGVKVGDLKIKNTPKGEYVFVEKKEKVRGTRDILREIVPRVIKEIHFPKTMRWDDSGLRFARPIESVMVLFGRDNVDIGLGGAPQKKVASVTPALYLKKLKLIDSGERRERIKSLISKEIDRLGADKDISEPLLEEVTFMVNSPDVFTGDFDSKFLELPADVLKASMAKHQRVFPVSKNGELVNKFIAVIDGKRDKRLVKKVYENILEAKLKDSMFFFDEDMKKRLPDYAPQLKNLIFQKDLGNMFEKIQRLEGLCGFVCDKLGVGSSLKKDVVRAAELSKLDLVTHMVGEFPSLQGIMGREYALRAGEKNEVAAAIGGHYLPQGMDDNLPPTLEAAVLALSDKIDNLVGFIGMGAETKGSHDPYGIRRNSQGLIQVIKHRSLRLSLDELIGKAIELYGGRLKADKDQLRDGIVRYVKERVEALSPQARVELRDAVLEVRRLDVVDIFNRMAELASISGERYFLEAAKVVERTSNILKGAKGEVTGEVKDGLFKEALERDLWQAYLESKDKILELINKERYKDATREYAEAFYGILHGFFDKVMVNVEDSAVRANRLAMMLAINRLYADNVADLAKIPQIIVD